MARKYKPGTRLDIRLIMEPELADALRYRAQQHERTLEQEARYILRQVLEETPNG